MEITETQELIDAFNELEIKALENNVLEKAQDFIERLFDKNDDYRMIIGNCLEANKIVQTLPIPIARWDEMINWDAMYSHLNRKNSFRKLTKELNEFNVYNADNL